jgi:hypothetical protein
MIPSTVNRVPQHTAEDVNEQIRCDTEERVARLSTAGRQAINQRLSELDQEWDIERTLEANAATLSLVGLTLGATTNRKWFLFPGVIAAFLLQHAVQGWCPPLPVFRRLGIRTASEIDYERYALKAIRGDFDDLTTEGKTEPNAGQVVQAMRR